MRLLNLLQKYLIEDFDFKVVSSDLNRVRPDFALELNGVVCNFIRVRRYYSLKRIIDIEKGNKRKNIIYYNNSPRFLHKTIVGDIVLGAERRYFYVDNDAVGQVLPDGWNKKEPPTKFVSLLGLLETIQDNF